MPEKHLLNQRQLESLTSPIRLAIIQRLDIDKEATVHELSQRMGRPVTSLYHHLKQLVDIGLLRVSGEDGMAGWRPSDRFQSHDPA